MGRNDLCFCMSGKKQKKCHSDIHEESLAASKLKIYGKLEQDLKKQSEISEGITLCVQGCTDCCHDYFTVQGIEFDLILNELAKWDENKLNNLIKRVEEYWKILESEHPVAINLLIKASNKDLEEINSLIEKTSFPCVFLDEKTNLCQIYDVRPFKCRVFGNTYYYPQQDEGAMGMVCNRYGRIINEDNFDLLLCDVTELLDKNTDLSIMHDMKRKVAVLKPEYPLIYYMYQQFIVKKLGVSIVNFDEKFKHAR